MIPGYLFLPVSPMRDDGWMIVHDTPTIRGFIRDSNRMPAVMSNKDMQDVMCAEARLNSTMPDEPGAPQFKIGEKVKYLGNIYWQWEGVVGAIDKAGRVRADGIPMFGQPTSIWVRPSEIEKCN
jgi:transcription antitermination factor NusG